MTDAGPIGVEGGDLVVRLEGRIAFAAPLERVSGARITTPSVWTHPVATIWYGAMFIVPISVAVLVILNTDAWFGRGMADWKPFAVSLAIGFAVVGGAGALLLRAVARRLKRTSRRVVITAGDRRYAFDIAVEDEPALQEAIERLGIGNS